MMDRDFDGRLKTSAVACSFSFKKWAYLFVVVACLCPKKVCVA